MSNSVCPAIFHKLMYTGSNFVKNSPCTLPAFFRAFALSCFRDSFAIKLQYYSFYHQGWGVEIQQQPDV